jgi:probable rRNA maturation factor
MEPPSPYSIPILNSSGKRIRVRELRHAIRHTLAAHALDTGTVSVLLTDNESIRSLNRDFRGIDEATDVLTFPASDVPGAPSGKARMIGDIAISTDYAADQARLRGVALEDEIAYLGVHGALHLAGFDDETEPDRRIMQAEMARIGAELGLAPVAEWSSILHEVAHR